MDYISILDPIPWDKVALSVLQTITLYWLLLIGMKLVGRRVFGEMGPQDMIILLLVAEACDLGLSHEGAGYWGTVASVVAILFMGNLGERVAFIRRFLEDSPIELLKNGQPLYDQMKKCLVEEGDLLTVAREYGMPHYTVFESMVLESDGSITGVLKPEYRVNLTSLQQLRSSKPV